MKTVSGLNTLAVLVCFSVAAPGQLPFAGKWQTKISPATGKHSITVNIIVNEGKIGGTVVLVNPDRTQLESPILNPEPKGKTLRFQTNDQGATFDWSLVLKKGNVKGLLHGNVGEMLIDQSVTKERQEGR
jgi:hypothetical protein